MKAAEDGCRYDAAHVLDGAMDRSVLVERPMSPQLIIIDSILRQNPAQVRFAENNQMVVALASDRSNQPFGEAVLPRRAWGDGLVTDAHGAQSVPDGSAVDLIPIADQVARGLIPREPADACRFFYTFKGCGETRNPLPGGCSRKCR